MIIDNEKQLISDLKKLSRIRELSLKLNDLTKAYDEGHPQVSDKEWDDLYFELQKLEEEANFSFPFSPTQKIPYQVVNELKKVKHNHLMLSLDKTKSIDDVEAFVKNADYCAMLKMDGLTCSLLYENGELVRAETRGNGEVGEDVTHNALAISSIPNKITYKDRLIIDGEIICTYKNFEKFSDVYKNPRNFASGSIRLLDSKECAKRNLIFVAWDVIEGFYDIDYLYLKLLYLQDLNFTIVPFSLNDHKTIEEEIKYLKEAATALSYPIDGIVFKYESKKYRDSLDRTGHHFKDAIAYKFYDETYPTHLRYIQWTMGRTGVLTPVAVFDPIEIDGTIVERASLHNVSMMREILGNCAYGGELLQIYKANQIIPQIAEAGPKLDYGTVIGQGGYSANDVIERCPICGREVEYITSSDGVINVYCSNPNCEGKLINRLEHFCGKKGLDIKGLSKATFEKLVDWGWIGNIEEVFSLSNFKEEWIKKPGFGIKSVEKILQSIEDSKYTTLNAFISAIGIPLIGQNVSKDLAKHFKTYNDFRKAVNNEDYHFYSLDNFGKEMDYQIKHFDYTDADEISEMLIFEEPSFDNEIEAKDAVLKDKIFVITGKLINFKNRDKLKEYIVEKGGTVVSTVSLKTDYLINNDINSTSTKNLKAKELNIPIITEAELLNMSLSD